MSHYILVIINMVQTLKKKKKKINNQIKTVLPKSGEQITSEKSCLTVWAADHLHLQFNSAKSLVTCFYLLLVPPKPGEEKKTTLIRINITGKIKMIIQAVCVVWL